METADLPDQEKRSEQAGQRAKRLRANQKKYLKKRKKLRAEVSQALKQWETSQQVYRSRNQFARAVGVTFKTLVKYISGRSLPTGQRAERLYRITGLACLSPDHLDLPAAWARRLRKEADKYTRSLPPTENTAKMYRRFFSRIVTQLVRKGIGDARAITPDVLVTCSPKFERKWANQYALGFFGRFLLAKGLRSEEQGRTYEELLKRDFPPDKHAAVPRRPPTVQLVKELTVNCGLSSKEIRALRRSQIEPAGIRLDAHRLLRYGDGPHCVSQAAVHEWRAKARPTDFLFYQLRPRDRSKPVLANWIWAANKGLGVKTYQGGSTRMTHFEADFARAQNLRGLRLHLRYFHGISEIHSAVLINRFLEKTRTFDVPKPYVLVTVCASRLLLCRRSAKTERGKACSLTWPLLFGRYKIP